MESIQPRAYHLSPTECRDRMVETTKSYRATLSCRAASVRVSLRAKAERVWVHGVRGYVGGLVRVGDAVTQAY